MGIVFLLHITTVAFIIGVAMIAPVAELLGMRQGGERWERMAHQIASSVEKLFAWGATWAAFSLVALWGLYPRLWGVLTSLFLVQTIIIAGLLWFVMTVSAYVYYLSWERMRNRRLLHNAIGWTFVLSTMVFISTIITFDSYQLTPAGGPNELLHASFNPSYLAELPHRHVGNLSYGGLVLAAYVGGWFLLFRGRGRFAESEIAYHNWLGDVALLIGLGVMLLQPVIGWFYVLQIQNASYGAYYRMMIGENAWMFLVQMGFLGAIFLLGNLYMYLGIRRGDPNQRTVTWMKYSLVALALLLGLGVLPSDALLGSMRPWKYLSLAGFMLVTIINLVLYLRARPGFVWSRTSRSSQATMLAIGVLAIAIFVTMGIIRESARGRYLIYDRMPSDQAQEILRP